MGRPRKYKHNYPSVTEIVDIIDKPGLRYWYGKYGTKVCEKKKRDSQGVGHGVHKGIEKFLQGVPFDEAATALSNDQRIMLSYLTDWCSKTQIKPIAMEEVLYSKKYEYGGTPDVVATFDGGKTLTLVDWKTDSVPRDGAETKEREAKYGWQLAGYAIAYEEMKKVRINYGIIVRASKDLRFSVIRFESLTDAKKEFKMLRKIFRRIKGK